MHLLIGWLYRQPEEFVGIMEQREQHALIIVAPWGVLLKYMDSSWLRKGWSKHVVSRVSATLREGLQPWIEFPLRKAQQAG
jgi:hypothetical protein